MTMKDLATLKQERNAARTAAYVAAADAAACAAWDAYDAARDTYEAALAELGIKEEI